MKFEVIDPSTEDKILVYRVSDLSMLDFQEWSDQSEIAFPLDKLMDEVTNLDSPDPASMSCRFYIADPIEREALERLTQLEIEAKELTHDEFEDMLSGIEQRVKTPEVDLKKLLLSVAKTIMRDYPETSGYKVRITDG
jgi:hypothetical protein